MGWSQIKNRQVVKYNGKCLKKSQWKYCPFWTIRRAAENGRVIGFYCSLFSQIKNTERSLPECNARYGISYEGDA